MKKRNVPLEALRFIFMIVLCLIHYDYSFEETSLNHGYLCVEFFFVLAGFFMYKFYLEHPEVGTLDFTIRRIKKFFMPVMISFFLMMFIDRKKFFYPPDYICANSLLDKYFAHFHEFFLLQGIGLTNHITIMAPFWFISVLVIGGGILYSVLVNFNKKATSVFIPILVLFGINYNQTDGTLNIVQGIPFIHGLYPPFVRGCVDMGLGIITSYVFYNKIFFFKNHFKLFDLLGCISLIGFSLILFASNNFDYLVIVFLPMIVIMCLNSHSFLTKFFIPHISHIVLWLGGLSMYMFFIHFFVISLIYIICNRIAPFHNIINCFTYVVFVVIAAFLLKQISIFFQNRISFLIIN